MGFPPIVRAAGINVGDWDSSILITGGFHPPMVGERFEHLVQGSCS